MVESFLDGNMPRETWEDGVFVAELVMASYMAAENGKTLSSPPKGLKNLCLRSRGGLGILEA